MIYLICLDEKLKHAKHYLGFSNDPAAREKRHYRGDGARMLRAAREQGITWSVVKVWEGSRSDERRLKRRREAKKYCPRCAGEKVREVNFLAVVPLQELALA